MSIGTDGQVVRMPNGDKKVATKVLNGRELLGMPKEARRPILSPWLEARRTAMVYAPVGVGKTWITLSIAAAAASGGAFAEWSAPEPSRVLLCDGEMEPDDLRDRLELILPGLRGDPEAFEANFWLYSRQCQAAGARFPDLSKPDGQGELGAILDRQDPHLVILDSFSTLWRVDDENAATSAYSLIDLLTEQKAKGRCVLVVHHSNKIGKGDQSYRGTSNFGTPFDTILRLEPVANHGGRGAAFKIQREKYRGLVDDSMQTRRCALCSDTGIWEVERGADEQLVELIALVRSRKYRSQRELAEALGVSVGTVNARKRKVLEEGLTKSDEWSTCLEDAKLCCEDAEEDEEIPF